MPLYYGKLFERTITEVFHRHGYEFSLFLMIIAAFCRLNILSVIFVLIATILSFCAHFFNSKERKWIVRLACLKWFWRLIYVFLSVDMLR